MKTFLSPEKLRRGQPVMNFVSSERMLGSRERTYWLGTYHEFKGRGAPAVISDYNAVSKTRISRELYLAFLKEARRQRRLYNTPLARRRTA